MIYSSTDSNNTKFWVKDEDDIDTFLIVYQYMRQTNIDMAVYSIRSLPSTTLIIL